MNFWALKILKYINILLIETKGNSALCQLKKTFTDEHGNILINIKNVDN